MLDLNKIQTKEIENKDLFEDFHDFPVLRYHPEEKSSERRSMSFLRVNNKALEAFKDMIEMNIAVVRNYGDADVPVLGFTDAKKIKNSLQDGTYDTTTFRSYNKGTIYSKSFIDILDDHFDLDFNEEQDFALEELEKGVYKIVPVGQHNTDYQKNDIFITDHEGKVVQ